MADTTFIRHAAAKFLVMLQGIHVDRTLDDAADLAGIIW